MPKPPLKNPASVDTPAQLFTEAGAANILRLLEGVRSIVMGLLSKGYAIRDGRLIPSESGEYGSSSMEESETRDITSD